MAIPLCVTNVIGQLHVFRRDLHLTFTVLLFFMKMPVKVKTGGQFPQINLIIVTIKAFFLPSSFLSRPVSRNFNTIPRVRRLRFRFL